jgi:periplasmic protein TonB
MIETDGTVQQLSVTRSGGPDLDKAALDAVSQWHYEPARRNGVALAVPVTVSITFGQRK